MIMNASFDLAIYEEGGRVAALDEVKTSNILDLTIALRAVSPTGREMIRLRSSKLCLRCSAFFEFNVVSI